MYTYPRSSKCRNVELTFATYIKQSTFIGNSDSKPCKNQRCCVKQHITEIVKGRKCTDKDDTIEIKGILPSYLEYNSTQKEKSRESKKWWDAVINKQILGLRRSVQ